MKGRWKRKHKEQNKAERVGGREHRRQQLMEKEREAEPFGSDV